MSMVSKPKDRSAKHLGIAVAFGIAVGTAIGAAVGDIGRWMALGVPMGVAVYWVIGLLAWSRQ